MKVSSYPLLFTLLLSILVIALDASPVHFRRAENETIASEANATTTAMHESTSTQDVNVTAASETHLPTASIESTETTEIPVASPSESPAPVPVPPVPVPTPGPNACPHDIYHSVYKLYKHNEQMYADCHRETNHSFPFDGIFGTNTLIALSKTKACLVICDAVLQIVTKECDIGRLPVRSAAEMILKTAQDLKENPSKAIQPETTSDQALEQIIFTRRNDMLGAEERAEDPTATTPRPRSIISMDLEGQLAKYYQEAGGVPISPENVIELNIEETNNNGNEGTSVPEATNVSDRTAESSSGSASPSPEASAQPEEDVTMDNTETKKEQSDAGAGTVHSSSLLDQVQAKSMNQERKIQSDRAQTKASSASAAGVALSAVVVSVLLSML